MNRADSVAAALNHLAPRLPAFEAGAVLDRALASPGLRGAAPENAAWLALVAYARHAFTEYDAYLDDGYDRDSARHFILDDLNAILAEWGARRRVSEDVEPDGRVTGRSSARAGRGGVPIGVRRRRSTQPASPTGQDRFSA